MIKITFVAASGAAQELQCKTGQSLMEAAVGGGINGIEADCGGMLTCGTCHVFVRAPHAAALPPPDADERAMLGFTSEPATPASRLSCQLWLTEAQDGMTVDLPASQH